MSTISNIYVVGYPKSGNTWLARMVAKATQLPVSSSDDTHPEVAADVNKAIEDAVASRSGWVFKLHQMPDDFKQRLERDSVDRQIKVVYIYRDIPDVFISSFFYFKKGGVERYIEKPDNLLLFLNPVWLVRRLRWRFQLNRYLHAFIAHGYSRDSVTYAEHLSAWFEYLKRSDNGIEYAITKYEDLIDNPIQELERICGKIGFQDLDVGLLGEIARSESFSSRKKDIERTPDGLTFGKEFNKRFLRAGKAGDHKRFLTDHQISLLRGTTRSIGPEPD